MLQCTLSLAACPLTFQPCAVACRYNLTAAAVHVAVQHALQQVGLADYSERPTSSLSGGQKQRVAIAGALAECPRVRSALWFGAA